MYKYFEFAIQKLIPYFECDVENNDNAYIKSLGNIKSVFNIEVDTTERIEAKYFTEETEISAEKLLNFVKSWSAYINFKKINQNENDDPVIHLKCNIMKFLKIKNEEELRETKIKFSNFYFVLVIKNQI